MSSDEANRPRRDSLETFNLEMAPLDRPIEGEVEYEDEPPSRWRQAGALVGIVLFVGLAGALLIARQQSKAATRTEKAQQQAPAAAAPAPAAPVAAAAQPAAPAPVPAPALAAATPEPAPAAAAEADADEADAQAAQDAAAWRAPPRAAWAKIRTTKTAAQTKSVRPANGKVTYRKTTTVKRTVIVKHTVSGRR
jgi:hypothetical protein